MMATSQGPKQARLLNLQDHDRNMMSQFLHCISTCWPSFLVLIVAIVFLSSSFLMQKKVEGHFAGLEDALRLNEKNEGVVRLMFVHGMGLRNLAIPITSPGSWPTNFR